MMGFFGKIKEAAQKEWNKEDAWSKKAEQVGEKVGEGVRHIGGKLKEKYNKKFGGGEYREERIKELNLKAKEAQAKTKIAKARMQESRYKAQKNIKPAKGVLFGSDNTPNYGFITGQQASRKKDPYAHLFGEKKL